MKHFTHFKSSILRGLLSLFFLTAMVSSAWGTESVYKTVLFGSSYNSAKVSSYTASFSATNNGFTVNLTNFNNNNNVWDYVKTGNKSNASEGTIITNTAIDKAITKVTITIDAITSSNVNSITLYSGTSANSCTTSEGTFTSSTGAQSVTITSPSANKFYKISFDCKKGSSNGLVTVSKVEYYYDNGGGSTTPTTVAAPTLSVSAGTYIENQTVKISNYNSKYIYAYTTDGSIPAIDSERNITGTTYDNNAGIAITSSCTLKVIAADENGNTSAVTSTVYTINKPLVFESLEELVAADITTGTIVKVSFENVPIKDIFITKQESRNGVYFDIQKGENDIEIYYKEVPDTWVVGGTLSGTMTCPWTYYENTQTWELAPEANSWSWDNLSYTAPANQKGTPTIAASSYKTSMKTNDTPNIFDVTYDGDGSLSVTSLNSEVATATINENTITVTPIAAGTTTITISAEETENYYAASKHYTLTVSEPAPAANLPFSFDKGVADIKGTAGMTQSGLSTDYAASPKLKFDSQGDNVVINYGSSAYYITYMLKGNSTSGTYAFDILESADGKTYTIVHSHTTIEGTTSYTDKLKADSRYVKFVYTTKASGNIALGNITISNEKAEAGLAFEQSTYRFTTDNNMTVKASSAKGSSGAISYALKDGDERVFIIDENTGEITCETTGTYTVTATITETDDYKSGTANCTIQIKNPIVANSIIVAEANNQYFAMTNTANGTYIESVQIEKIGDKYVVKGKETLEAVKYATTKNDNNITIVSMTGQYLQATAAKNVNFSDDEYQWTTNAENVLTAANNNHGTLQYNTGNPRFTTYETKVGQYAKIVSIDNVLEGDEFQYIAENRAGFWATFSNSESAVQFDDATTVYTISMTENTLVLNEVKNKQVPANNGVLIFKEGESDVKSIYAKISDANALENNLLKPASENMTGSYKFYKLAYGDWENKTGLGFYWGNEGGIAFTCKAGTAYLAVPTSAGASEIRGFSFDDLENGNETAIPEIDPTGEVPLIIYTMTGIRIPKVVEDGLYIVNGKTKWMIAE